MSEVNGQHKAHVIVGVDGSEYSTEALQVAGTYAEALGSPLAVITCWSPLDRFVAGHSRMVGDSGTDDLDAQARKTAEEAVQRAFGSDSNLELEVRVKYGSPAKVLVEESAHSSLLVVGRRGRGGFFDTGIGSVAASCAAHAQCPVLIVNVGPDTSA